MRVYKDITETVGNTPLIKLNRIGRGLPGNVMLKAEFFNPLASVKDRIGKAMIDSAESTGQLGNDPVIVEPTSGNTGIALAFICAARGYRLILVMPETMSLERRALLKIFDAEVVLTPGEKGMKGAVEKADEITRSTPGAVMLQQFNNPANPRIHRETTGKEIWDDTEGNVDIFVAGIGTGGTITGVGEYLKERSANIKLVGVEPSSSSVLSGGQPGPHKIQGIGAGFVPKILKKDIIDEIMTVHDEEAGEMARRLAREEGILVGISAGANVKAAVDIASRKENSGRNIVTILCDTGERYLSTWLFAEYLT